jgi:hypothetical protein
VGAGFFYSIQGKLNMKFNMKLIAVTATLISAAGNASAD